MAGNVQPATDDPRITNKRTYWESNGQITRRVAIISSSAGVYRVMTRLRAAIMPGIQISPATASRKRSGTVQPPVAV